MTGLCGWFDAEGQGAADDAIAAMAAELTRFDNTPVRLKSAKWGAVATAARDADGDVFQDRDRLAVFFGCGRFTDPKLEALGQRHGLAYALIEGYDVRGIEILQVLTGSFAFGIFDSRTTKGLLAVDRMGVHSLCYTTQSDKLIFSSTLDAINAFPGTAGEMCRQAIYEYVYFHMVPGPQTIYRNCKRLLPGTFLRWENGALRTAPYWEIRFIEDERRPLHGLREHFLELLRNSVADAVKGGRTGAFLSGGTDSSTITGLMREVTGQAPRTYSIGFDVHGFDEISYARIAARHFGAQHHEYYVTPDDVVNAIPRIAALHDQPFGNSSAVPTYYCAMLAKKDGIDTLLGGDGGDELFGGNARYAKQYLYSLYSDLPAALRKGLIEPVAFALPQSINLVGKMQRYIRNASQPMPARYDNYNLLERLGTTNVFTAEFLAWVNAERPRAMMAQAYKQAHAATLINRMLALDLRYTLADNDLPKVRRSCELAGLDVRFPMLDDAVVAFAARLAPELKLKGTQLRYFFKEALREFLPGEILIKKKHGFGLPFGLWLESHTRLQEIVGDSLSDLKRRFIVRPEFIDELSAKYVHSHASYYGPMVWVLMMLEQWFRRHSISKRA